MTYDLSRLRAELRSGVEAPQGWTGREPRGVHSAAVLVLMTQEPDPRITFIQRALTLRKHAGQVAFPGGGLEAIDSGPTAAALREANEEVGLDPSRVTVLGRLPVSWIPVSGFDVTPIIGTWPGDRELGVVDPGEVASVFQVPVSRLVDPEVRVTARLPGGYRGPAWRLGDLFLWGFTGHLVDLLLNLAGWAEEWNSNRAVDVPPPFMRP